jgi:hypothetical protein
MKISNASLKNTLNLKRLRLLFSDKVKDIHSSTSTARSSCRLHPLNLYQHCSDLPLSIFIDCLINKNLRRLTKSGNPTQKELTSAWDQIYSEYCDLSGSPGYKVYMLLNKEIGYLRSKILAVKCCLEVLRYRPSDKAISQLRAYGYAYVFDFEDKVSYLKDLTMVGSKIKTAELALELKTKELLKMNSESKSDTLTESTFTDIMTALSKYIGHRIDPKEITVSEFASIRKMYDQEMEHLRKESEKLK